MRTFVLLLFLAFGVTSPLSAATVSGIVSDTTGAALPSARVTLRAVATGEESCVNTDWQGRYSFEIPTSGRNS